MESNQEDSTQLTSYLKSMFTQYNGEQHSPPPPQAPREESSPVQVSAGATVHKEEAAIGSEPSPVDLNNNTGASSASREATSPLSNGNTIQVDVIVHNSAPEPTEQPQFTATTATEQDTPTERAIVGHNKISLSFLDELKHTLSINKPPEKNDDDDDHGKHQNGEQEVVKTTVELLPSSPLQTVNKESLGQESEPKPQTNEQQPEQVKPELVQQSNGHLLEPSLTASGHLSNGSSVQDDSESSGNEEVSVESGIDLDDQSSVASEPNNAALQHLHHHQSSNGHTNQQSVQPPSPPSSSSSSTTLTRSVSTDSPASLANQPRKVVMRSVSQDVKFKLESIKEERKVTKTHVSELASFWKDRMISPKDKPQ